MLDRECNSLLPPSVSIKTRLVDLAPGKYMVEMSSSADGRYGLLCDDGWSNREAALICQQHGYNVSTRYCYSSEGGFPILFPWQYRAYEYDVRAAILADVGSGIQTNVVALI